MPTRPSLNQIRKTGPELAKIGPGFGGNALVIKITEEEVVIAPQLEDVVLYIRRSAWTQTERFQAITDGAILAGEQVQDKRIAFIEKGPELAASQALFEVLFTLAVESTIAGKVLSAIAKRALTPVLKTNLGFRAAALAGGLSKEGDELKALVSFVRAGVGGQTADDVLQAFLSGKGTELKIYDRYLSALLTGTTGAEQNLAAIAKAAKRSTEAKPNPSTALAATDSPGVAIMTAAQSYASEQRHAIFVTHAALEAGVRARLLGQDDIEGFLSYEQLLKTPEEEDAGIRFVRDRCELLFEAAIWVKLFKFDTNAPQIEIKGFFPPFATLEGVPQPFLDYWLQRFINPQTGAPFSASNESQQKKVSDLNQFFLRIGKKFREGDQQALRVLTAPVLKAKPD